LNTLFHPCAGAAKLGRFLQFLACGVTPRTQLTVPNFKSIAPGVRELGGPKSGVSHWLSSLPLQQCYALSCYTVMMPDCDCAAPLINFFLTLVRYQIFYITLQTERRTDRRQTDRRTESIIASTALCITSYADAL